MAELYGLEPLPVEGGLFRRTWAGPLDATGRPTGSAIMALFAAEDELFSAMHRLPLDEVWHFYLGDSLELLLLHPDGSAGVEVLGRDVLAGQRVQLTVPAGTWMGAQVAPGGRWSLCGTTMAPGFVPEDYEGGDLDTLLAEYPAAAEKIRMLCRRDAPLRLSEE
ncbi:cupin domain-containing protein [Amycolatopsis cihanbeyliensis]|uniref:cupin domain-containing protein n=1 Tax=Amycolatopsis cihanbeyliensis TaxID=1128664 RepID=UPI001FE8D7E9|nr:cupin domain-containing protein [Amycolatopsis cihanbeyliensis]